MSVPQGFYELARTRDLDLARFDALTDAPEWPVFVRFVPVRESAASSLCGHIGGPCTAEEWIDHYPREVIYAGPVLRWQVPLVVQVTRAAIEAQWPLSPICPTWGTGGRCLADRWELPYEVAPIAPDDLFPWPYHGARWTRTREKSPPIMQRLYSAGMPQLVRLTPAHPQEIAQR